MVVLRHRRRHRRGRAAPRVLIRRGLARRGTASAATRTETTTAAATARSARDLGRGIPQRWADLIDVEFVDRPLLTLASLEGALLEATGNNDAGALGQGLRHILGRLAPDVAPQEQCFAVFPFIGLTVEGARRRRHREVGDRGTGRRKTQLRVGRQIPDDGDNRFSSHVLPLEVRGVSVVGECSTCRSSLGLWPSLRSGTDIREPLRELAQAHLRRTLVRSTDSFSFS